MFIPIQYTAEAIIFHLVQPFIAGGNGRAWAGFHHIHTAHLLIVLKWLIARQNKHWIKQPINSQAKLKRRRISQCIRCGKERSVSDSSTSLLKCIQRQKIKTFGCASSIKSEGRHTTKKKFVLSGRRKQISP